MKLESLKSEKFRKLENEQMNKINGGAFSLAAAGSSAQTPVCTGERGGGSHADPDERDCDDDKGNWIDCYNNHGCLNRQPFLKKFFSYKIF